jgi:hypothetical protein
MATSKRPVDFIPVPQKIIELSKLDSRILCNLRPEQRSGEEAKRSYRSDDYWMHTPVNVFLKNMVPGTKVIIHFQGYGPEKSGTAIVQVNSILWAFSSDYPRLDFIHPEVMKEIHGCPNFWGAFILAIAKVSSQAILFAKKDDDAEVFVESVSKPVLLER